MSEPIYTTIEIGGSIPRILIDELIKCLCNDLDNMGDIPDTNDIESFINNNTFSCNGFANWGSCDETKKFCIKNNLSYIEENESTGEYEATVKYKLPDMNEEKEEYTDTNHHLVIRTNDIKPYIEFLLKLTKEKDPKIILALYVNDPILKDLVALCYKDPDKTYNIIAEKINDFLPSDIPDLPPFVIE